MTVLKATTCVCLTLLLAACAGPQRRQGHADSAAPAVVEPMAMQPAEATSVSAPAVDTVVEAPVAALQSPVADAPEAAPPVATAPAPAPVKPAAAPVPAISPRPALPAPAPAPVAVVKPAPATVAVAPKPAPAVPVVKPAAAPVIAAPKPPAAAPEAAVATGTSSLRGQIQLRARSGQTLQPDEVREAVLWFQPNRPLAAAKPARFTIQTRNKRFEPRTLVVPVGSTVDFPNSDPVIHNVFSLAPGNEFDLGLYGEGESAEAVLRKPGVVMAFCNVHYSMFAALVVVDTPYSTAVAADGSFELRGLPAGGGTLHLWHPRAEAWQQTLVLPSPTPLNIDLAVVKTLIPQHTSKTGGSYRPAR